MRKNGKILMMAAAVATTMAGGSALYAQTTTPQPKSGNGTMIQGQRGDMMMNMMAQMNQMMESCNEMMKGMDADDSKQRSAAQPRAQWPFPQSYGPVD